MSKKKTEQIYKQEAKVLREKSNRYKGKHVMVVADKIFAAKTAGEAKKLWRDLREKYPDKMPLVTYVPKADSLILWL